MKARALKTVIKPDYRQFRLRKLNTPEFSHIKLLLFWPVFGLAFLALERFRPHAAYHVMHCALDDAIPFSEWALIPYLLWFVYLIGALAYTFFQDVPAFRRMMRFVIVTYTAATVIYFIYPTQQLLRRVDEIDDGRGRIGDDDEPHHPPEGGHILKKGIRQRADQIDEPEKIRDQRPFAERDRIVQSAVHHMIGRMGAEALQRQKRQPENRPKEQQLDVRKFRRVELTQAKLPVVRLYDRL